MFTVKATYHGHTRKHTFSDHANTFPTYDQICHQLHRVFPITQNYYLSKLLFSPDAAQPSRILLSKEVRNAFDYHRCIRQFKDRTWSHALLRFTVMDEVPLPSNDDVSPEILKITSRVAGSGRSMSVSQSPGVPPLLQPSGSFQMALNESSNRRNTYGPQHTVSVPQHHTPGQVCCSVSQGKAEIKAMLHNFQEDLNRVMTNTFEGPTASMSMNDVSQADISATSAPPPFLCSWCTQHRQGTWYSCDKCHVVVCEACHNAEGPGFCLSVMGPHQMKLASSRNSGSYVPIPRLPPWTPRPESSDMTGIINTSSVEASSASSAVPLPVIHKGIACDVCHKIIEGIRHKCLDCPDYDLCTPCMTTAGVSEIHNPFHEFFEINEPGRVIVHTVFSGDGERESQGTPNARAPAPEATVPPATHGSEIHFANCDLCDSRIRGDRYKCLDCPDFDTCVSCFSITNEQHPNHGFVKIQKKEDFIRRRNMTHAMHNATCNGCSKRIFGLRFKCMHPDCPDYDLCESCEAFPIPVHPSNHPILKMKAPDIAIPTVYRVGQTSVIPPTAVGNEQQTSINTSRSPESTPSGIACKTPLPAPLVPVHDIPVPPPVHARPSFLVDEIMRSCTPVAHSSPVHFGSSEVLSKENQAESPRSLPTPEPPKLPLKPDMISQQSWASIPNFFNVAPLVPHPFAPLPGQNTSPFAPLPGQNSAVGSQFSFSRDVRPSSTIPPLHGSESMPAPKVAPKDNGGLLPSVPNHIPNPWPTTNPTEREELLKLIAEFSGPFIPVPPRPVSPFTFSKALERPTATPPRNNPFLTPPSTSVVLPQGITPPSVDRLPVLESRPLTDDPRSIAPDVSNLMEEDSTEAKPVSEHTSVVGSPLSGEALLNRPASSGLGSSESSSYPRSLAELMRQLPALVPSKLPNAEELPKAGQALTAIFVNDVTVPDGQAFPPGAEFVKCWRILNTSDRDWPENTELVFLAGDSLSDYSLPSVLIGQVAAGAEFDVWTGELKAPDAPGRYIGYWRLKADGELFGNSLWIEINVVESDCQHSSDDSMAASSIIMPDASSSTQHSEHAPSTTIHSLSAASDDNVSDMGSDSCSVSLISMPSSPSDDEDEALFHDSRSQTVAEGAADGTTATGMDYVMLYDDNSSSEE